MIVGIWRPDLFVGPDEHRVVVRDGKTAERRNSRVSQHALHVIAGEREDVISIVIHKHGHIMQRKLAGDRKPRDHGHVHLHRLAAQGVDRNCVRGDFETRITCHRARDQIKLSCGI